MDLKTRYLGFDPPHPILPDASIELERCAYPCAFERADRPRVRRNRGRRGPES